MRSAPADCRDLAAKAACIHTLKPALVPLVSSACITNFPSTIKIVCIHVCLNIKSYKLTPTTPQKLKCLVLMHESLNYKGPLMAALLCNQNRMGLRANKKKTKKTLDMPLNYCPWED